jgi:predicted phosphodiesterase
MKMMREIFRGRAGRIGVEVAAIAVALCAAGIVFGLTARGTADVGPVSMVVRAQPAMRGVTVVEIPPFGEVRAPTHSAPLRLTARVERIDFVRARAFIETATPVSEFDDIALEGGRSAGLAGALARAGAVGTVAGLLVMLLVLDAARRGWRTIMAGALALMVLVGVSFGATAATWSTEAFREPVLTGGLTYLPGLADVFTYRVSRIERLRTQAAKVASNLAAYYADDRSLVSGGALPETYRVLHVTDLHLDAVGAELAARIARSYEASLVIDTGDAPILGVELETAVLASLLATDVPRIYIPGNHDSPATAKALSRVEGVTVLATGTIEVDGLRVHGVGDPISRTYGVEPDPTELEAVTASAVAALEEELRSGEATPDVIAIHNPAMEKPFIGLARVILSGHTHSARMYVSGDTVRLNSGTIGGMPYHPDRAKRTPLPHGASVLYYSKTLPRTLVAIDRIEVHADRTTTVTRRVFAEELLP